MFDWEGVASDISIWIGDYARKNDVESLVIGVSGGVDSAVTSTLSAMTGMKTIVLNMPIHQKEAQISLSNNHIKWMKHKWDNIEEIVLDLSSTYDEFCLDMEDANLKELALANSRARLRMTALYAIAGSNNGIVVGTGNKVEDFGVGFFTKYGDGGVDISPIADLYKSEVYALGKQLGILKDILDATPTDGLWNDGRSDEDQIGATYDELEWAMKEFENPSGSIFSARNHRVMGLYRGLHEANQHKMEAIPVFKLKTD